MSACCNVAFHPFAIVRTSQCMCRNQGSCTPGVMLLRRLLSLHGVCWRKSFTSHARQQPAHQHRRKEQNWFALAVTTHTIHTPAGQKIAIHAALYDCSCARTLECPCSNPPSRAARDVPLIGITSRLPSSRAMLMHTCFPPFLDFSHHRFCPFPALFLFCPGPLRTLRRPALAPRPRRLAS